MSYLQLQRIHVGCMSLLVNVSIFPTFLDYCALAQPVGQNDEERHLVAGCQS